MIPLAEEGRRTTELAVRASRAPLASNAEQAALFERVAARVYRYFLKSVWDETEAEELAQRTFFLLTRSVRDGSYDAKRSFNVWLWMKAHSVFVDWCRERKRRPARLPTDPALAAHGRDPQLAAEADDILHHLHDRLGAEAHEIFVLRHEVELTQEEIAEATGRDRKTIAKRLAEAEQVVRRLAKSA
jgi:RNA polymerase sigma factor (sigma-70 family)